MKENEVKGESDIEIMKICPERYCLILSIIFLCSSIVLSDCTCYRTPEPLFDQNTLEHAVSKYLNSPYQGGRQSEKGFDCSGFVQQVFADLGRAIPRTVKEQYKVGKKIHNINRLIPGDLVFFDYKLFKKVSHVGIYLGNYRFAHVSPRRGVVIDSLNEKHFFNKYVSGCRLQNIDQYGR